MSLFAGSFRHWRVDPSLRADILSKVREMGFGIVETCVPWSVHEDSQGRFDFGEGEPRRDLPRFLGLCREAGMNVLVRPGPNIDAELNVTPSRRARGSPSARCRPGGAPA